MLIYIIIGEKENVGQDTIGGPFVPHPYKESVKAFLNKKAADKFIENSRLKNPKKESFGDLSYYKGGYFSLDVEECELE